MSTQLQENDKIQMQSEISQYEHCIRIKADILAKGINVKEKGMKQSNFNLKQIHLYQHHLTPHPPFVPEDIILYSPNKMIPRTVVSKVRYNPSSEWSLTFEGRYQLKNETQNVSYTVCPTAPSGFENHRIHDCTVANIVQKMGVDCAGVIISNYCHYFTSNKECRFCEIYQNYKRHKTFQIVRKPSEMIIQALISAFEIDQDLNHILLNSGNMESNDQMAKEFLNISRGIQSVTMGKQIDFTGILMPPDDFTLIDEMGKTGFDKVYFDIEIFDPQLFEVVCPGKAEYGYEKIFKSLSYANNVFGLGSAYTNLVYGIQSLPKDLDTSRWDPQIENQKALEAVDEILARNVVPIFSVYHYSGHNYIGSIPLDAEALFEFGCEYGKRVHASGIIPKKRGAVICSSASITNTLLNDGYNLSFFKELYANLFNEHG